MERPQSHGGGPPPPLLRSPLTWSTMAGTEKIMASLNTGFGSSLFTAVFFLLIFLPSCSRYTLTKGSVGEQGGEGEGQSHTHWAQPPGSQSPDLPITIISCSLATSPFFPILQMSKLRLP